MNRPNRPGVEVYELFCVRGGGGGDRAHAEGRHLEGNEPGQSYSTTPALSIRKSGTVPCKSPDEIRFTASSEADV